MARLVACISDDGLVLRIATEEQRRAAAELGPSSRRIYSYMSDSMHTVA